MNILFMIPRLSYTGAPKMMSWVANKMSDFGHDVEIISMYKSQNQQILNKDIKYIQLSNKQSMNWLYRNTIGMLKVIREYRKKVKEIKPDVIVSFLDSVSYFYIFLNYLFWHNKILVSERVDPYSRHGWRAQICFKILSLGNYIVFQTEEARNFFKHKYDEKSSVIGNPVVLSDSMKKAIEIRDSNDFTRKKVISMVGRLSITQKRQDVAIKAFSIFNEKYKDYKLYIYGSGNDEKKLKELIDKLNLNDQVIFMGQQDNIPEKIVDSECFILTSDFEGIPNALIEAMSVGLPCISTDCSPGGAKLLIDDKKNGFLVKKGDYLEIANRIEWIINHPEDAKIIGNNAKEIMKTFSEDKIANMWENVFMKFSNQNI